MSEVDPESTPELWPHAGRRWAVLHTRARHEKKVATACTRLAVPVYLPLRISHTFSGRKLNTFHIPMFPGYVFAALAAGEVTDLKRTNSVSHKIDAEDEPGLLEDLRNVRTVELARLELQLSPTFRQGQQVMVKEGPLAGVTGRVVRYKNHRRLQVVVTAIHQAILVDVAVDAVVAL